MLETPARPNLVTRDFYEVLGVKRDATDEEIRVAYRQLVHQWHPDRHLTNKEEKARRFMEAHEAYVILMNPDSRALYDHINDMSPSPEPSPPADLPDEVSQTPWTDFTPAQTSNPPLPPSSPPPPENNTSLLANLAGPSDLDNITQTHTIRDGGGADDSGTATIPGHDVGALGLGTSATTPLSTFIDTLSGDKTPVRNPSNAGDQEPKAEGRGGTPDPDNVDATVPPPPAPDTSDATKSPINDTENAGMNNSSLSTVNDANKANDDNKAVGADNAATLASPTADVAAGGDSPVTTSGEQAEPATATSLANDVPPTGDAASTAPPTPVDPAAGSSVGVKPETTVEDKEKLVEPLGINVPDKSTEPSPVDTDAVASPAEALQDSKPVTSAAQDLSTDEAPPAAPPGPDAPSQDTAPPKTPTDSPPLPDPATSKTPVDEPATAPGGNAETPPAPSAPPSPEESKAPVTPQDSPTSDATTPDAAAPDAATSDTPAADTPSSDSFATATPAGHGDASPKDEAVTSPGPSPSDPSPSGPSPTEPSPADPSPTDPSPTDPSPIAPSPSAPSPSDPSPSDSSPISPSKDEPEALAAKENLVLIENKVDTTPLSPDSAETLKDTAAEPTAGGATTITPTAGPNDDDPTPLPSPPPETNTAVPTPPIHVTPPADTPIDIPADTPVDTPTAQDTPTDAQAQTAPETALDAPGTTPAETPAETPLTPAPPDIPTPEAVSKATTSRARSTRSHSAAPGEDRRSRSPSQSTKRAISVGPASAQSPPTSRPVTSMSAAITPRHKDANGKSILSPPPIPPLTASNGMVPAEWHYPLHVSLETLYTGARLRYRVTRYLLSGQTQETYVDIEVKPGWRKGTKIRFAGLGNERAPPQQPQDVIFIVDEIPHSKFRREGSNLFTTVDISLLDALCETSHTIQGLDGKDIVIDVDFAGGIIRPGDVSRVIGKGMPIRRNSQVVGAGDLTIKWNVVFPDSLSTKQRLFIRQARDEERDDRTSP